MKNNLPFLNQERLNLIFEGVYDAPGDWKPEDRIDALINALRAMQQFNYRHRWDDTRRLFALCNPLFHFEPNSEGTTLWLALILAIQELYGFSDGKLVELLQQVTVRK